MRLLALCCASRVGCGRWHSPLHCWPWPRPPAGPGPTACAARPTAPGPPRALQGRWPCTACAPPPSPPPAQSAPSHMTIMSASRLLSFHREGAGHPGRLCCRSLHFSKVTSAGDCVESEQQAIACTSATCCWPWACAGEAALVIPSAGKELRVLPTGPCSKSQIHRCPWLAAGSTSSPPALYSASMTRAERSCIGFVMAAKAACQSHCCATCRHGHPVRLRCKKHSLQTQDMTLHQCCLQRSLACTLTARTRTT